MMIRFYKKYTVEPLYKGQVGFVPYTVEPLYKDKLGTLVPYTVEPLYKGQVGDRGCPLLRGNKCTVTRVVETRTCHLFRGCPLFVHCQRFHSIDFSGGEYHG